MYTLTLTAGERAAFDWVGHRYATGHDTGVLLYHCMTNEQKDDGAWDSPGDITFSIPEYVAWQISDLAEQEDMLFPCFAGSLKEKMIDLCMAIV